MPSAEPVEVIAMKSITAIITDPKLPKRCVATAGGTKPLADSSAEIGNCKATAQRPKDVAKAKGMVNQNQATKQVSLVSTGRLSCNGWLPIGLVYKNRTKVTHNVDDTKLDTTTWQHGEIWASFVFSGTGPQAYLPASKKVLAPELKMVSHWVVV